MKTLAEKKVRDIVADDYRASRIFRARGLDFCCGGDIELAEVCEKKHISLKQILKELTELEEETGNGYSEHYNAWSLTFLIDYIENNHHAYVRKVLPEIQFYGKKVFKVHGKTYPALSEVYRISEKLATDLPVHLEEEERELFPLIRKMEKENKGSHELDALLRNLENDHEDTGEAAKLLEELTGSFTPPEGACASFRILFKNLEAFTEDLYKHVHLENNILFPRSRELNNMLLISI